MKLRNRLISLGDEISMSSNILDYMKKVRHDLHMYPELSLAEVRTAAYIRKELEELKIPYIIAGNTGTIGVLDSGKEGKTLLIRADIDALPIKEETGFEYASKNDGVMHACGHDIHTAALLGFAKNIVENKTEFKGKILLAFQPAEEVGKGAFIILEALKDTRIDEVISSHVGTETEFGMVNCNPGKVMSGIRSFTINIRGKGGHASRPDEADDVIHAMVSYIDMATRLKDRKISPQNAAVMTFANVHGGTKANTIPDLVTINGSIRFFDEKDGDCLIEILENTKKAVEISHGVEIELILSKGSNPLINNPEVTKKCRAAVSEVFGRDSFLDSELIMATDDFSRYLEKYPGCYIFIGARSKGSKVYPVHSSRFNPDENIMELIVKYYQLYIENNLK